ncbi:hypothetical protein VTI74DRAFT_9240 [Chaetomium olivicolor]
MPILTINLGYTAPINRPNQSPILAPAQVWAGLQRKVRRAQDFVPVITACEVLSTSAPSPTDTDAAAGCTEIVTRTVTFAPGRGPLPGEGEKKVREVCKLFPPCRVDFWQEDGTKIANYVTQGEGEGELYLTYVFQWRVEGVEEGSEQTSELEKGFRQTARMAVEESIKAIRTMVEEGKLL